MLSRTSADIRLSPNAFNALFIVEVHLTVHQLLTSERWFSDPAFLLNNKKEWLNANIDTLSDSDPGIKNCGEGTREVNRDTHKILIVDGPEDHCLVVEV